MFVALEATESSSVEVGSRRVVFAKVRLYVSPDEVDLAEHHRESPEQGHRDGSEGEVIALGINGKRKLDPFYLHDTIFF